MIACDQVKLIPTSNFDMSSLNRLRILMDGIKSSGVMIMCKDVGFTSKDDEYYCVLMNESDDDAKNQSSIDFHVAFCFIERLAELVEGVKYFMTHLMPKNFMSMFMNVIKMRNLCQSIFEKSQLNFFLTSHDHEQKVHELWHLMTNSLTSIEASCRKVVEFTTPKNLIEDVDDIDVSGGMLLAGMIKIDDVVLDCDSALIGIQDDNNLLIEQRIKSGIHLTQCVFCLASISDIIGWIKYDRNMPIFSNDSVTRVMQFDAYLRLIIDWRPTDVDKQILDQVMPHINEVLMTRDALVDKFKEAYAITSIDLADVTQVDVDDVSPYRVTPTAQSPSAIPKFVRPSPNADTRPSKKVKVDDSTKPIDILYAYVKSVYDFIDAHWINVDDAKYKTLVGLLNDAQPIFTNNITKSVAPLQRKLMSQINMLGWKL